MKQKKHYDHIIKYFIVKIFSPKINLPSKQTTKIHKTTVNRVATLTGKT